MLTIVLIIKGLPFFSLIEKTALRLVISLRHNTSLFVASEIIVLKTIVQLHDDVTRKRNTCMCYCLDVWITESVNNNSKNCTITLIIAYSLKVYVNTKLP